MSKKIVKQIFEFGGYSLKVEEEINVLETIFGNEPIKDIEICQILYQVFKVQQCLFCSGMGHTYYGCSSLNNFRTAPIQILEEIEQEKKAAQSTELPSKGQILEASSLEKNQVLKRKFKEQGVSFVCSDSEDSQEI